jgi:cell wall-associated NlpC family hydrolase
MRSEIIKIAEAEIGTLEIPKGSNKTKYGEWFGWNGVAWCAIFISWVFAKAGKPLGRIGFTKGFAGCDTGLAHFRKLKYETVNPLPGDIVFFDFNGNKNNSEHVGIYHSLINANEFWCIEGNTSPTEAGSQSNGDGVYKKRRKRSTVIAFISISEIIK